MTSSAFLRTSVSLDLTRPGRNQALLRYSPGWSPGTIIRFSSAVMLENSCAIWKVRSMPVRNSWCGLRPVTSAPSKMTEPLSGTILPATILNSVDLPAPFGPISPVTDPRRTESEQLLTAVSPPKRLLTLRTSMTASKDTQTVPFLK